jgi:hypothetical protein
VHRRQQPLEVVVAGAARAQVGGHPWQVELGHGTGQDEIHVDVQNLDRLRAADIARVGLEKVLELRPAAHGRMDEVSWST